MALATLDDLTDHGVCTDSPNELEALLEEASQAVQDYTGQDFERIERTATIWPTNGYFELAGRNVTGVSAVNGDGDTIAVRQVGAYRWWAGTDCKIVVTFTSGWAEVPASVKGVVCSMVARAASVDASQLGHSQDTAGPFSFTIGSAAAAGAVGMLPGETKALDAYRRKALAVRATNWVANA